MRISKQGTIDSSKISVVSGTLQVVSQLPVGNLWSIGSLQKPPTRAINSCDSDVDTNDGVSNEKPSGDQRVFGGSGSFLHDVEIRWVEG